jgi:hypothetical protein
VPSLVLKENDIKLPAYAYSENICLTKAVQIDNFLLRKKLKKTIPILL